MSPCLIKKKKERNIQVFYGYSIPTGNQEEQLLNKAENKVNKGNEKDILSLLYVIHLLYK
jgi:hypothetical protein